VLLDVCLGLRERYEDWLEMVCGAKSPSNSPQALTARRWLRLGGGIS
jgi:hypothetical protein